jgi:hypothetical protein
MKLTYYPIVYTGVTAVGVSSNPALSGAAANIGAIPLDTRLNPQAVWGSIVDGGVSTYTIQYTTSDVLAAGYNPATDPQWTNIAGGPTTGTKPFQIPVQSANATAIRLNVTVGPATVTLGPIFQADSNAGA